MRNLGLPRLLAAVILAAATILLLTGGTAAAADPCAAPVTNKVACENTKPGDPPSDWQVNGIGDSSIQGFATSMSVNLGQTVNFKIKTPSSESAYRHASAPVRLSNAAHSDRPLFWS